MNSKKYFLSLVFGMTVLFLVGMAGCDDSIVGFSWTEASTVADEETEDSPKTPQTTQKGSDSQTAQDAQASQDSQESGTPPAAPPSSPPEETGTPPAPPPPQNPPSVPHQEPENPTWYVSAGADGNDANAGTDHAKPLATVRAALNNVKAAYHDITWKAGDSAVIVISGTITAAANASFDAMVDISGAGSYPPIILEGDPLNKGVLNANRSAANDGRVLYIGNNKVTLADNLTLTGGYTLWGGGVLVGTHGSDSAGEFIMAGGEVSGNTAYSGGGVMVYKGRMSMTGGIIQNNANYGKGFGGGVYVHDAGVSFTMDKGIIRGNGGTDTDNGGGVYVNGTGFFTMTGGEILNNTVAAKGGGVCVTGCGDFTMSGGTISGNTSVEGGGVYVSPYGGIFNHNGGTVSGNTPN